MGFMFSLVVRVSLLSVSGLKGSFTGCLPGIWTQGEQLFLEHVISCGPRVFFCLFFVARPNLAIRGCGMFALSG